MAEKRERDSDRKWSPFAPLIAYNSREFRPIRVMESVVLIDHENYELDNLCNKLGILAYRLLL